ncbi:Dol-P-Man:Man(7)GlcNAc(2)-PP-Dol alpha-1,6-mannosyltransferase [Vitis vinifera]|uniref:Dol-P-Man:Man(7)GlcNAc(2)-PP-Dol alpha-1,6-mannosyltransferase n=1 Tax=Vitis vinifera TaxID=29760 RepID=A0A438IET0_VITVI|nr:Dol-P-Man:Man(7)GlcNAc(2)-PP-Dol alpha-1,6-mannosyltransferase [Vitis vinifera]
MSSSHPTSSLLKGYITAAMLGTSFIISSVPIFKLSAAIAANRIYNNRKKSLWKLLYFCLLGLLLISLGCTIITFMASYNNYPSGYGLKHLHQIGESLSLSLSLSLSHTHTHT